jgi:hypothetical protein
MLDVAEQREMLTSTLETLQPIIRSLSFLESVVADELDHLPPSSAPLAVIRGGKE